MHASFDLNSGCTLEISDGSAPLSEPDPQITSGGRAPGLVGLQVVSYGLGEKVGSVAMRAFVKPSQARALASAILSAATEARGE